MFLIKEIVIIIFGQFTDSFKLVLYLRTFKYKYNNPYFNAGIITEFNEMSRGIKTHQCIGLSFTESKK